MTTPAREGLNKNGGRMTLVGSGHSQIVSDGVVRATIETKGVTDLPGGSNPPVPRFYTVSDVNYVLRRRVSEHVLVQNMEDENYEIRKI